MSTSADHVKVIDQDMDISDITGLNTPSSDGNHEILANGNAAEA